MMKYLSITIFSALLILSSCVREEMPDGCETDAKLITFSPAVEASVQTKSTESWPSESWKLTDEAGEFAIPLTYYSAVNTSDCFSKSGTEGDAEIETKGVKINNISEIPSFSVCAFDNEGSMFIPSSNDDTDKLETVTYKDGKWNADGTFEWTDNTSRTFFAYANAGTGSGIKCTSQTSSALQLEYAVPENASSQTDFLLGYFKGTPKDCETESSTLKVPMSFTHAMASVRFKLSPSLKIVDKHKITEIKISGVYKSGTVKIGSEGIITWSDCSDDGFSVFESKFDGYVPDTDYSIGESFFLIPQSEGKVTITVTIKNTANDEESRKVTATLKPEWQAGHSYVYTFGEGFMPEICDDTSIKNVGNEAGYFRVAVIAYVVDGSGVVVGPSVTPAINTTDGGWTSDDNGFYYYASKVERGTSTPAIVSNEAAITESGAKLKILVQASKDPFNN